MIKPPSVILAAGESAQFCSEGGDWSLSPEIGEIVTTPEGRKAYKAPHWILNSRTVYLIVRDPANPAAGGTAEIHLTSSLFWLKVLAIYWPALFVILFLWGWHVWPGMPADPVLLVNPPAVTLGAGQSQQFTATLNDAPDPDVTWSATSGTITPAGFYAAPAKTDGQDGQAVTITATRNSDRTKAAAAVVILTTKRGLFLYPAMAHVKKAGRVTLTADGGEGTVQWPKDVPNGTYVAPAQIDQRQVLSVSVSNGDHRIAGARIVLLPDGPAMGGPPSDMALLTLAALAGALGAWLASVKSFTGFTGTRSFVPSWSFFYLFRPGFGAGLALVVHMAHRVGSIGAGSSATNPAVVVFYSALVGLFSEEALEKLYSVFCAIFGIQDKRTDKMGEKAAAAQGPAITAAAAVASRREISIDGTNFVATPTVLVNNVAQPATFVNDKKLTLAGVSLPAAGETVTLKVRNPDGKESAPFPVTVAA